MKGLNALLAVAAFAAATLAAVVLVPWPSLTARQDITLARVGVLPNEDPAELKARYEPLLEHLSGQTGLRFELVVPESYAALLDKFERQELELAYFGGLTFVKAGADPLVMRDVDAHFTTYFVVKSNGPLGTCVDLLCDEIEGRVFSFGSRLSTSGHLMPRYYLQAEHRIDPERHFREVRYSGAHDRTIYEMLEGKSDLAAVNSLIYQAMLRDGRLGKGELKIIWETPPYPNYVWAVGEHVSEDTRNSLRDAYLMLAKDDEEHAEILSRMGAESFIPAGAADYALLRQIADSLDIQGADDQ